MKKRIISLLLAVVMLAGMLPASAFAAGGIARAFAVNVTNGVVYNAAGETIKAAYPGDTVRVVGKAPVTDKQIFDGWTVETAGVTYTENGQEITFTMPSKAVNITANYRNWGIGSVYVDVGGRFVAGDSIPFEATTAKDGVASIGYSLGAPSEGVDTSGVYNYVRWVDNTLNTYLQPGDVFVADHVYTVYVCLEAQENCYFNTASYFSVEFRYFGKTGTNNGYYNNPDSTKWTMVSMSNIKPAKAVYDINLKNAVAYDVNGNKITKALPGDEIRVVTSKPLDGCGNFKEWIVEPAGLEYTESYGAVITFTMPESDVSFTADYESLEISDIFVGLGGPFSAGDEIPYTFYTIDGQIWYTGYGAGTPAGVDTENFYNHMSWFDTTTWKYMKPGDVFEDGHEYSLTVNIQANEYCHFPIVSLMNVSFGHYGESHYIPGIYEGADASKYIYVQIDGIKTYKEYSINTKNCIARNEAGEIIYSALPGEKVNIVLSKPLNSGDFLEWNVKPYSLEYTIEYGILKFTMPYDDVSIEAEFDKIVCNYLFFDIGDEFMAGDEIIFDASFLDEYNILHGGYMFKTPWGVDPSIVHQNMSWLDTTTGEYAMPGDPFKAGHVYRAIIYIAPTEYCYFDSIENMELEVGYVDGIVAELHEYDHVDPSQWLYVVIDNITTVPQKAINVTNGVAYNANGEVITSAYAGEVVTITAEDPTGVQTFFRWSDRDAVGDITFENNRAVTTTFVMPDRDVNIYASFNYASIKNISFELDGYYQLCDSQKMNLTASGDAGFRIVPFNDVTDYMLCIDDNGEPATYPFVSSLNGTNYWLRIELVADEGYGFFTDNSTVTLTVNGKTYRSSRTEYRPDYKSIVYNFYLDAPEYVELYDVYVNGGIATQYGEEITYAPAGSKIYLVPNENTDDAVFGSWKILSGEIELLTDDNGDTYFIMPEENVWVEAIFKGAIYTIYINDLDIPVAGMCPDYDVTLPEDGGYSHIVREEYGWINGIIWSKQIDQFTNEKIYPDTVFEEGETYFVSICLQADSGYWFDNYSREDGYYSTYAFVNGTLATVSIYDGNNMESTIAVSIEYTVPKAYNITVEGGNAYDPRGSASGAPTGGDGEPITSAVSGTYIKAVADIPEGYEFIGWEIVAGELELDADYLKESVIWFEMPNSDVYLVAHTSHLQHEVEYYSYNNDTHWAYCSCGEKIPESEAEHEWNEETECICGAKGYGVLFYFEGDEWPIFGVTVVEYMTVTEPAEPAQEDKIFTGWYTEDGVLYDFETPVTEDIKLYARFKDVMKGDVNGDGRVNSRDSLALKSYLKASGTSIITENADMNDDGRINSRDVAALKAELNKRP